MAADVWLGLALGAGIGVGYVLTSLLTHRLALRGTDRSFVVIALGGVAVRMFVALILVTLVLTLAPVRVSAFVAAFFGTFFVGLITEIVRLHRGRRAVARKQ